MRRCQGIAYHGRHATICLDIRSLPCLSAAVKAPCQRASVADQALPVVAQQPGRHSAYSKAGKVGIFDRAGGRDQQPRTRIALQYAATALQSDAGLHFKSRTRPGAWVCLF